MCETCGKADELCVCSAIIPVKTKIKLLILQHPQEPREQLSTARILQQAIPGALLRVGLSWRSLRSALGTEAENKRWCVLYLGGSNNKLSNHGPGLILVDRKGSPLADSSDRINKLEGIVALDGTWSQAKTLWWRNPWLLKLERGVLIPRYRSKYGTLRREPRKECLSTLESVAEALTFLESDDSIGETLRVPFLELLEKFKMHRN